LVRRSHGGVSSAESADRVLSLNIRMTKNATEKRKIAKKASSLLADGQIIMLDGSSTAAFLIPYVAEHREITLFTNNMLTALRAIEHGINTHCIGGRSINASPVLSGEDAYRSVATLRPDILFFSSQCVDANGVISDYAAEENYLRALMLQNAKQSVFLCDSEKFDSFALYTLTHLKDVDYVVFDTEYKNLRAKCNLL
jgi:DeoR family fructose operon transcriptional repressor